MPNELSAARWIRPTTLLLLALPVLAATAAAATAATTLATTTTTFTTATAETTDIAPTPPPTPTEMVLLPGGTFVMGREGAVGDNPAREVTVASFFIDVHEVTNAQYAAFCAATDRQLPRLWGDPAHRCGPGYPDHPVVCVSWLGARAYAEWAGRRLPTEAEWEYAARGGLVGEAYPHGAGIDSTLINYSQAGYDETLTVGSLPANGYGLYDMAGNVVEWVADRYEPDYYRTGPATDPPGPERGKFRVIRGGGWYSGPACVRVDFRNALPSNFADFNVGFRCAQDAAANGR